MSAEKGGAFVVTRKISLDQVPEGKLRDAITHLVETEPVIGARMDEKNRLHVSYDASCIGIRDIEDLLRESGLSTGSGFWRHLKFAWYAFLDENAKSNARSSGACCNRPPSGSDAGKVR